MVEKAQLFLYVKKKRSIIPTAVNVFFLHMYECNDQLAITRRVDANCRNMHFFYPYHFQGKCERRYCCSKASRTSQRTVRRRSTKSERNFFLFFFSNKSIVEYSARGNRCLAILKNRASGAYSKKKFFFLILFLVVYENKFIRCNSFLSFESRAAIVTKVSPDLARALTYLLLLFSRV